jgi:hypothetical protein
LRSLFFIFCFFVLLFLGTNGTTPSFSKGELELLFFFFLLLLLGASGRHHQASAQGELQLPLFFFSFNVTILFSLVLLLICFPKLVRKFALFCFVVFTTLVDANPKKNKDYWKRGASLN